ncbi:hypothetical protein AB0M57_20995 [Streptomyces sp. NPDC051597]
MPFKISWIVGLGVTSALYWLWARRTANPPAQTIHPAPSGSGDRAGADA